MDQTTGKQVTEFVIGTEVVCNDGTLGELKRVVVDPIARAITHLVVEPRHRHGTGHLVPVELVSSAVENEIRLRCTASEFSALEEAEEMHFIPGATGAWNYPQSQMLTLPYYPAARDFMGFGATGMGPGPYPIISDRVPAGEIEIRRGERVYATDGAIGRVQGLVVNPSDNCVTHFLLEEGHLWGKKRVAIPITDVTRVDDGVQVCLSKQEVEDLPAVSIDVPN